MPKKNNKDLQNADKNRPKSKQEKKDEQKKHKQVVIALINRILLIVLLIRKMKRLKWQKRVLAQVEDKLLPMFSFEINSKCILYYKHKAKHSWLLFLL